MTDLQVHESTVTTTDFKEDPDDKEKFAHIVVPASAVTEAYITGAQVTALCGKTWVPNKDPQRFKVCPTCKEILDAARAMKGNNG